MRKLTMAMAVCFALLMGTVTCFASDTFQKVFEAPHFTKDLGPNSSWSHVFNTNDGEIDIRVRNMVMGSSDKRFHLVVHHGKDTIYDQYYPQVDDGYSLLAFKDTANGKLFFALESLDAAYLFGYEAMNNKFEVYVDSRNYYNNFKGIPKFAALTNGNLVLAFERPSLNSQKFNCHRYRFAWSDQSHWFSYTDLGMGWQPVSLEDQ